MLSDVDNSYKVNVTIDSLGNLTSLSIKNIGKYKAYDSLFTNEIANAFNSISWYAGSIDDTPVTMHITMLIVFIHSTEIKMMETNSVMSTISVDSNTRIKIDSIKVYH